MDMEVGQTVKCRFKSSTGWLCEHAAQSSGFCKFHVERDSPDRGSEESIQHELLKLIEKKDGQWHGFRLPKNLILDEKTIGKSVDFPIFAASCDFGDLQVKGVSFTKAVDFSNSTFNGDVKIESGAFSEGLSLAASSFDKKLTIVGIDCHSHLNCLESEFKGSFFLSGRIGGTAQFNNAKFHDSAEFRSQRHVTAYMKGVVSIGVTASAGMAQSHPAEEDQSLRARIVRAHNKLRKLSHSTKLLVIEVWHRARNRGSIAKKKIVEFFEKIRAALPIGKRTALVHTLFYGETHFQDVTFFEPKRVLFTGVDLSRARFIGTDLRDVKFIGAKWYQKELGRDGLFDDVWLRSTDYSTKMYLLPDLEQAYRYIRFSMESVKDFGSAGDFYVGEMDAARKKKGLFKGVIFSILALYNALSRYGTSPGRVCVWIFGLAALYSWVAYGAAASPTHNHFMACVESDFSGYCKILAPSLISSEMLHFTDCFLSAIQIMTLQKTSPILDIDNLRRINIIYTVLGPVLISLLVLAFRGLVKRH